MRTDALPLDELSPVERLSHLLELLGGSAPPGPGDPLWRLAPLTSGRLRSAPVGGPPAAAAMLALLAYLESMDSALCAALGCPQSPYLLDDATGRLFPAPIAPTLASLGAPVRDCCVEVLHTIGLVYRLPVAKKFGYDPRRHVQVRLNSWGRAALMDPGPGRAVPHEAADAVRAMVAGAHARYAELWTLLSSGDRPLNTDRIHALNEQVPVPIVA